MKLQNQRFEVCAWRLEGDTGLQLDEAVAVILRVAGWDERYINIRIAPGEARRGHTNNRVQLVVQFDGLAQYVAIGAELLFPEEVADHCNWRCLAVAGIGGAKLPSQVGRHS